MCELVLDPMVQLSGKSKNPDLLYRVAVTMSNLSQNTALKEKIKNQAANSLKVMLENEDTEIRKEAASALADLGEEVPASELPVETEDTKEDVKEENKEDIQEQLKQKINDLLQKIQSDDSSTAEQAAAVLAELSHKKDNRAVIRNVGGQNQLLAAISKENPSLIKAQIDCVRVITELAKEKNKFKANIIPPLGRLAKINDPVGLLAVLDCIFQLSKNKAHLPIFKKEKLENFLINASAVKLNEPLQVLALELLAALALYDVNVQAVVLSAKTAVPNIAKLLKGSSLPVQTAAIKALGAFSSGTNRKHQLEAKKHKVLEQACTFFKEKDQNLLIATTNAIAYIADSNNNNQNIVKKHNGVEGITPLTTSENQLLQQAVLQCTRACVKHNSKLQNHFRSKKVIPPLVQLIGSPNDTVKSLAAGALIELGRDNSKNCEEIAHSGAISLLVKELENPSDAVKYHCQGVIWALARKDRKRREAIKATGAVDVLKKVMKETTSEQVKKGCKWALEVLGK